MCRRARVAARYHDAAGAAAITGRAALLCAHRGSGMGEAPSPSVFQHTHAHRRGSGSIRRSAGDCAGRGRGASATVFFCVRACRRSCSASGTGISWFSGLARVAWTSWRAWFSRKSRKSGESRSTCCSSRAPSAVLCACARRSCSGRACNGSCHTHTTGCYSRTTRRSGCACTSSNRCRGTGCCRHAR